MTTIHWSIVREISLGILLISVGITAALIGLRPPYERIPVWWWFLIGGWLLVTGWIVWYRAWRKL